MSYEELEVSCPSDSSSWDTVGSGSDRCEEGEEESEGHGDGDSDEGGSGGPGGEGGGVTEWSGTEREGGAEGNFLFCLHRKSPAGGSGQ